MVHSVGLNEEIVCIICAHNGVQAACGVRAQRVRAGAPADVDAVVAADRAGRRFRRLGCAEECAARLDDAVALPNLFTHFRDQPAGTGVLSAYTAQSVYAICARFKRVALAFDARLTLVSAAC